MLLSETNTLELMDENDYVVLDQYIVQATRRIIANSHEHDSEDDFTIGNEPLANDIITSLYKQAEKMLNAGISFEKVLHRLQNVG